MTGSGAAPRGTEDTPGVVLVTGGAGFIGSHLVDALLARSAGAVVVLDRLSAGGSLANLAHHRDEPRLRVVEGDVRDASVVGRLVREVDVVVHAAAEAHVDRSIDDPGGFLATNVIGTQTVLEACRLGPTRMLMLSTDEVYGPGDPHGGSFDESDPLRPRSPYAASKAAADLLCGAYEATYRVPVVVLRGTNAFGPRQIERVVPTFAVNALRGDRVPVYGDGTQRREFLFVSDWVAAVLTVLDRGESGEVYNIGGGFELSNLDLAGRIVALAGAPMSLIGSVPDRPAHDHRYGARASKVESLGWRPIVEFDEGLSRTVAWYRDHLDWLNAAHDVPVVTAPMGEPSPASD
jgi:dTDP-glucose 4,6-dehydratase